MPVVVDALQARFPAVAARASLDHPALDVPAADILAVLQVLRDEHGFDMLVDLTAIDGSAAATPRFTVVYHLFSTVSHEYFRLATPCADAAAPVAPSATGLWPAANWHERETYDMFGITFSGHPDLRRILMWDGYPYFPLRKEFPLAGLETILPDPDVVTETGAKVKAAPMMGGPFVTADGKINLAAAEPRAKDESWTERKEKPE